MKLTFQCFNPHDPNEDTITLENVWPHDQFLLLKYQIYEIQTIPVQDQFIPLRNSKVEPADDASLVACGFHDGDVIKMVIDPKPIPQNGEKDPFKIAVRTVERVFLVEVCRSDTFRVVKERIRDQEGYPVESQNFGYADEDGKRLDDGRYHIVEPESLKLWLRSKRRYDDEESSMHSGNSVFNDVTDAEGESESESEQSPHPNEEAPLAGS